MRLIPLALLLPCAASAQIDFLAATRTGSDLYFVTSGVRLAGSTQSPGDLLFRLRAGELTPSGGDGLELGRPSISADGAVSAINYREMCASPQCVPGIQSRFVVKTPTAEFRGDGLASITANGRYASISPNLVAGGPAEAKLLDLANGATVTQGAIPAFEGLFATNDGRLLVRSGARLQLIGGAETTNLTETPLARRMLIAPDASRIAYETTDRRVGIVNPATLADQLVALGSSIALSSDGRTVSYLTDPGNLSNPTEVWLVDAATGDTRKLAAFPQGLVDQTISGDGLAVFVATGAGAIVKIDTITGEATELIAPIGPRLFIMRSAVPGSYNELVVPPGSTPDSGRLQVTVDGHAAPVLGPSPRGIAFQVPWEARAVDEARVIARFTGSPFEQVVPTGVSERFVFFLPVAQDSIRGPWYFAIHEDWSGVVRWDNPAHPGEVIHLYSMGWGPVDGTVPTGQPTPADRPYRVAASCEWRAYATRPSDGEPMEALFSGLAPGLVGLFQQDFRVPSGWTTDRMMIGCGSFVSPDPALVIPVAP